VALAGPVKGVELPAQVDRVLLEWGVDDTGVDDSIERVWQVFDLRQALAAIAAGVTAIAVKGNDAAGRGGEESTFILFQRVRDIALAAGVRLYIHGGVGVHTAAAYLALGAAGVHLDSQVALLSSSGAPKALKSVLEKLNGAETTMVCGHRVAKWPTMPHPTTAAEAEALMSGFDLACNLVPLGQDFTLAAEYKRTYRHLDALVHAITEAAHGHVRQAKFQAALHPDSDLAQELGVRYPIIQGPMARVSDTPQFLTEVARAGALPMLAVGMASAAQTQEALTATENQLGEAAWGAGLLGFIQPAAFDAQVDQILAMRHKPTAVVIAGGRPAQGKRFDKAGIKAFLHVPSATLLDDNIAAGARRFIFEGRESGGHVGPLYSTVLWEKQLIHLLATDDPAGLTAIFAGGIHDELSSAFVSIMAASLAAFGAKVGVIMGTAYLLTRQAVESGAITSLFQELATAADRTVLLESAPGQETRALPTPFIDFFQEEKARILGMDMDSLARRVALEELNLGRARVATKALGRGDGQMELTRLTPDEQRQQGLYMAGDVAALTDHVSQMVELHEAVTTGATDLIERLAVVEPADFERGWLDRADGDQGASPEPIAIIGMAGLFPDANNVDEYWRNILSGHDSIVEVPAQRWDPALFYRKGTTDTDFVVSQWGGFLSPAEFDPLEFGIAPATVSSVEPAQLLSLLVAKRALQDAGYADQIKRGLPDTSVIIGTEAMGELSSAYGSRTGLRTLFGEIPDELATALPKVDEDSFAGILSNVTSGRIANRFNCGGRNFTVDAACASSLAAVDVACQELWSGQSDMVICGGADLHNSILDYVMFSATHALSPRGYCATFDESGDGLALGEGVGIVILKRLSDAERDGDRVYAVIRGVQGSSDGRSLGLTAPNMRGQMTAIERAYRMAGVLPSQVGLIEAHGTGTAVGDSTELKALSRVMIGGGALPGQTFVGSVKTQIGHTKCAAGVAGLIRAALAVRHGVIPPTLHLNKPVKAYQESRSPFRFNANGHATVWTEKRRIAGVSGFGFGGTNFHAIVENYTPSESTSADTPSATSWARELFLVRGDTREEACEQLRQVRELAQVSHTIALKDVAYTLAKASDKPIQIAIVSGSWSKLLTKITVALDGAQAPGVYYRDPVAGKVGFLFSGQGSQRVGMARDLFVMFPGLRHELERHPELERVGLPGAAFSDEAKQAQRAAVTDTRNAQPLLGVVDSAIAKLLTWFGVTPDAVAGHSYGELPALVYAGVIDPSDLVDLSKARARTILASAGADPGAMAVVVQPAEETEELLRGRDDLWAVNYNSPTQVGVGGATAAVEALVAQCRDKGVKAKRIDVACAFHTPLLTTAEAGFAQVLADVDLGTPQMPVWSNTTAAVYPSDPAKIRQRLAEHLVKPVRFSDELRAMYDDGIRVFIEAGPGKTLTGLASATLGADVVTIATELSGADGMRTFLRALARWVASGRDIEVDNLFHGRHAVALDLSDPGAYAASSTVWMVDGQQAVPIKRWREQGEHHLDPAAHVFPSHQKETMLGDKPMAPQPETTGSNMPVNVTVPQPLSGREQLVYTYLLNMRAMLDDQRDILLTGMGLGQPGGPASSPAEQWGYAPMAPMAYPAPPVTMAPMGAMPVTTPVAVPGPVSVAMSVETQTPAAIVAQAPVPTLVAEPTALSTPSPLDSTMTEPTQERVVSSSLLPKVQDLSADQLKDIILEVVAEKTGYPPEMLGMDMDLEADLSIDSIKRLEILGALSNKIDMPESEADDADAASGLEQLAAIKTLRGMVDWLQQLAQDIADSDGAEPAPVASSSPADEGAGDASPKAREGVGDDAHLIPAATVPITRLVWQRQSYPFSGPTRSLLGRRFAITAGRFAAAVSRKLAEAGATSVVIEAGDQPHDIDGLIFIRTATDPWSMHELFDLVKSVDLTVCGQVVVFDDTASSDDSAVNITTLQGFPGFIKTMRLEYPQVTWKSITGEALFVEPEFSDMVLAEMATEARYPEVVYDGDRRLRDVPVVQGTQGSRRPLGDLNRDSVVIVLGGAQGISPALMAQVASVQPCHYVLVGRTARDADLAQRYADLADASQVQRHLIEVEHMTDPRAVKQRVAAIMKAKSIEEALLQIGASGADVGYVGLDIHDTVALHRLVDQLRRRFGHVDAVFHAAAVLEDKLFQDKTWESFERVYTTKTDPLAVIANMVGELKLLVLFSSMSSAFGNRGQCDYAAANSVFDQTARLLERQGRAVKAVAIAWGPWGGAGMVSPALAEQMGKRGLSLMPLAEGAEFFVDELMTGEDCSVMALAGQERDIQGFIDAVLTAEND
jgi:acyl transferase domain-containing protein/NAD(P)H-dependent flavin oxidoreductase YrpB (nitropropane dioxygenase family)/acyl carrier protein